MALPPMPKDEGKKLSWAQKIFSIDDSTDIKEIHKKYKTLAKSNHPDRLHGQNLPEQFVKQAQENFNLLREAYEILKSSVG